MSIESYIAWKLNPQQTQAALFSEWNSLILAWAWSWKTRVLTYKIANLIFNHQVDSENILAVTFTNKAANEMKERLVEISEDFLKQGLTNKHLKPYQLKWVWTFHSTFLKILKEDIEALWYEKNFTIYDESEAQSLLKDVLKKYWASDKTEFWLVRRKISEQKNKWILPAQYLADAYDPEQEFYAKIYDKYQKALKESNSLDFDDLLLQTYLLFKNHKNILQKWHQKFSYILVDEAQDTNQIQFDICYMLTVWDKKNSDWQTHYITMIWDDYQSIYGWRWAVMENFLNLKSYWPEIQIFKLETNYRSKPHIVQAWNSVIKNNSKQYEKNIQANKDKPGKIRVFAFRDEVDEAINIINLIKRLKQSALSYNDFAILYRTNSQSQPFEQILVSEWVPYKIFGWFKFFERKEIKDILWYIKYFLNPSDWVSLKRIINVPSRKIGDTSIWKLEEYAEKNNISLHRAVQEIDNVDINWGGKTSIKNFALAMKFLLDWLEDYTPGELIETLVNAIKYKEYLVALEWQEKAQERMENIGQLINLAWKYEKWRDKLREFMEEVALMSDVEEDTGETVKLMSVHSSKWLEFPVVFIVGLEDWMFPLPKARTDPAEMEEERRLMYVAITRAQETLFFSHASSRTKWWQTTYNRPSRFIDEVPGEILHIYELTSTENPKSSLQAWDSVNHKFFWKWVIMELWQDVAVVRFSWSYWVRKIDIRFLTKN